MRVPDAAIAAASVLAGLLAGETIVKLARMMFGL